MSGWIWMKNVDVAISDPIEPIDKFDKRPSVKDLIKKHKEKIDKVKNKLSNDDEVKDLFDYESKHDDLWILRYVLSHGKSEPATDAAKKSLLFRQKHDLDKHDLREYGYNKKTLEFEDHNIKILASAQKGLRRRGDAGLCFCPDPQRGVIWVHSQPKIDPSIPITREEWEYINIYDKEWAFQMMDYVSRTTGRLTSGIRLMDASQAKEVDEETANKVATSKANNKRMSAAVDKHKETGDMYPHLIARFYICNPKPWVSKIWRIVRVVIPKRIADKIDFVSPVDNKKHLERLLQYISEENLPICFGGTNKEYVSA